MNTLLCVFLVCLCLVGHCFSLELKNLCEADHFTYNDVLVNSVQLMANGRSLGNVSRYAIISLDNFEEQTGGPEYDRLRDGIADLKRKY